MSPFSVTTIFDNDTRGTRASSLGPVKFERDDPLYVSTLRRTTCDASGSYSFPRILRHDRREVGRPRRPRQGRFGDEAVDVRGGRLVKVTLPKSGNEAAGNAAEAAST